MGRPTKLDATLQKHIVAALKTGATVEDVCVSVGIHKSSFYDWLKRGETGEAPYSDFSDAVTRAQQDAKMAAIKTLRTAMDPFTETTKVTETFSETRIGRDGLPYEYKRVKQSVTKVRRQGDWRAALEYLKRRHYDEWGDRQRVDDWRSEAVELLKAGALTVEALEEEFGRDVAQEIAQRAGVQRRDAGEA